MHTSTDMALYPLLSWMSPAYPVGAFTFSQGLENAVDTKLINNFKQTSNWIAQMLEFGNGYSDLVFLACAWESAYDKQSLKDLMLTALAFLPTSELHLESTAQGAAFFKVTQDTWSCETLDLLLSLKLKHHAYPVVVGIAARGHQIDKTTLMSAFGHAYLSNLVSAAVRLVPLGQTDGQRLIASLNHPLLETIERALTTSPTDLATSTLMADITSMHHETQYTRLFRS